MKVRGTNIAMIRGDSESLTVVCSEPFGTGDALRFTVREDAESPVALQKTVTDFDSDGRAVIALDPEDTAAMDFGRYVYDIELTRAQGAVTTLVPISEFALTEEVSYG